MKGPVHRLPGLVLTDHTFSLPLDHADPRGPTLEVFAREVAREDKADADLPWLVFLQGGPGFPAPRPAAKDGWIGRAVDEYRVLLLDQRGTGRSTAQSHQTLAGCPTPAEQAARLACFRADSIVRDCEAIRRELLGAERRWTVLGQSFGGFCAVHYLSTAPEGLAGAIVTGGLPGLDATADDVYRRTWPRVRAKNAAYYRRYPGDVELVRRIARRVARGGVRLPTGDELSVRRFQTLGLLLGFSDGWEELHYLLEAAFVPASDELSYAFLRGFENALHFDTNPFFAILHEACYAQGGPTAWAAERRRGEYPDFEAERVLAGDAPVLFTGEMVFPWMFAEIGALAPLAEAAELLAAKDDWPALYDRGRLAANDVPVAAVVYHDDMYVDAGLSLETAAVIRGLEPWVTNEYEHNGLRADGARLFGELAARLARSHR